MRYSNSRREEASEERRDAPSCWVKTLDTQRLECACGGWCHSIDSKPLHCSSTFLGLPKFENVNAILMGDVAAILGLAPASGAGAGFEASFRQRAPPSSGASIRQLPKKPSSKAARLARELSALVGDNADALAPPIVRERT